MNDTVVVGPLEFSGRREDAAGVVGMFRGGSDPLTMGEWLGVLDSRRVLIAADKDMFRRQLGDVRLLGDQTLLGDNPTAAHGVLKQRGIFFADAVARHDDPVRICFVGVDADGDWLLVSVQTERNTRAKLHLRDVAMSVSARKCDARAILTAGIDPLDLFRWMNYWVEGLRNSRWAALMRAIQLEALFAAQDLCVSARTSFVERCNHKLANVPG